MPYWLFTFDIITPITQSKPHRYVVWRAFILPYASALLFAISSGISSASILLHKAASWRPRYDVPKPLSWPSLRLSPYARNSV